MNYPQTVSIIEVSPRDGLQNESQAISIEDKLALINQLANAGAKDIETGSFVSPKWVPQMADTADVFNRLAPAEDVSYSALVPNQKGLDLALESGVAEIALFAAATDEFSSKNLNCSVEESLERFDVLAQKAHKAGMRVRGYLSCVLGCPYAGQVDPKRVTQLASRLIEFGCYEVSLGDTIGTGTPGSTSALFEQFELSNIPANRLAMHCHDTYGQALANILIALQHGVSRIDASVAGLGGCPYAKGASGNVATEDVVYMLDGLGIEHGLDLNKLIDTGNFIAGVLGKENQSRAAKALRAAR